MSGKEVGKAKGAVDNNVDNDVIELDINHLTIDEIDFIETSIDAPIDSVQDPNARKGKLLKALALVILRRENPNATPEEAGRKRIQFKTDKVPPTKGATS